MWRCRAFQLRGTLAQTSRTRCSRCFCCVLTLLVWAGFGLSPLSSPTPPLRTEQRWTAPTNIPTLVTSTLTQWFRVRSSKWDTESSVSYKFVYCWQTSWFGYHLILYNFFSDLELFLKKYEYRHDFLNGMAYLIQNTDIRTTGMIRTCDNFIQAVPRPHASACFYLFAFLSTHPWLEKMAACWKNGISFQQEQFHLSALLRLDVVHGPPIFMSNKYPNFHCPRHLSWLLIVEMLGRRVVGIPRSAHAVLNSAFQNKVYPLHVQYERCRVWQWSECRRAEFYLLGECTCFSVPLHNQAVTNRATEQTASET